MPDAITCPRRMNQTGPWEHDPDLDRWKSGDEAWEKFPWPWKPRRCSFCGSLHPDDAMRLLREGWVEEKATGKQYKAYFYPPAKVSAMRAGLTGESEYDSHPKPPAKLYVYHLNKEQIAELNDIHRGGPVG